MDRLEKEYFDLVRFVFLDVMTPVMFVGVRRRTSLSLTMSCPLKTRLVQFVTIQRGRIAMQLCFVMDATWLCIKVRRYNQPILLLDVP